MALEGGHHSLVFPPPPEPRNSRATLGEFPKRRRRKPASEPEVQPQKDATETVPLADPALGHHALEAYLDALRDAGAALKTLKRMGTSQNRHGDLLYARSAAKGLVDNLAVLIEAEESR